MKEENPHLEYAVGNMIFETTQEMNRLLCSLIERSILVARENGVDLGDTKTVIAATFVAALVELSSTLDRLTPEERGEVVKLVQQHQQRELKKDMTSASMKTLIDTIIPFFGRDSRFLPN